VLEGVWGGNLARRVLRHACGSCDCCGCCGW
jgi:hypothetical protein